MEEAGREEDGVREKEEGKTLWRTFVSGIISSTRHTGFRVAKKGFLKGCLPLARVAMAKIYDCDER